jgi:hypothetical protein
MLLENERLRLTVLPDLGGKLGSLVCLESGREHFLQPPEVARRLAEYGAPFERYDTSGFDECFPTVGACHLADGTSLPDHGELWSVPWSVTEQTPTSLHTEVAGVAFPYLFRRQVSLDGASLVLDYQVENRGPVDLTYLWSAHPLLQVAPGDRIELPAQVKTVAVEWSAGGRLEGQVPWTPQTALLGDRQRGWADKLFAGPLLEGWCRLAYSDGGSLTFRFPVQEVPYVGLWICQGGWPGQGRPGHYTVALEPCTAPVDGLDRALEGNSARVLLPGARARWRVTLEVCSAKVLKEKSVC